MKNIGFKNVMLNDGFWKERYELNAKVSTESVYKRFEETGRFDALRFKDDGKRALHIFYDSDVAKWIEGVANLIANNRNGYEKYEKIIDDLIDDMAKNQRADGYLNSYFQQRDPNNTFTRRDDHELYCAGHLLEAAIAYFEATNKRKFLDIMLKYVDCIENAFVTKKTAKFSTPGHEEIEMALIRLYNLTKDKRHLSLAKHFIYSRGQNPSESGYSSGNAKYTQNNVPAVKLIKAEGHAVRATYFYTAMARYASQANDKELLIACKRIFEDIMTKMYITGGIGSARLGESFTVSYDLPNLTAYSESCAAIGLMMFCRSMFELEQNAEYHDVIERILYNGFLSSTSLDGKSFFYENPLEVCLKEVAKETSIIPEYQTKLPPHIRSEVFNCSCCPPNITRTVAGIADYIYAKNDTTLYINQFIASDYDGVKIETDYPVSGKVKISGDNYAIKTIMVRKPFWCASFSTFINGKKEDCQLKDGYIILKPKDRFSFEVSFDMPVVFMRANKRVRDNAGKVAVMRGPVVYAAEGVDNGSDLFALSIDTNASPDVVFGTPYKIPNLICKGCGDNDSDGLYIPSHQFKNSPTSVRLIPYYTFSNRGESDMAVWLRVE